MPMKLNIFMDMIKSWRHYKEHISHNDVRTIPELNHASERLKVNAILEIMWQWVNMLHDVYTWKIARRKQVWLFSQARDWNIYTWLSLSDFSVDYWLLYFFIWGIHSLRWFSPYDRARIIDPSIIACVWYGAHTIDLISEPIISVTMTIAIATFKSLI